MRRPGQKAKNRQDADDSADHPHGMTSNRLLSSFFSRLSYKSHSTNATSRTSARSVKYRETMRLPAFLPSDGDNDIAPMASSSKKEKLVIASDGTEVEAEVETAGVLTDAEETAAIKQRYEGTDALKQLKNIGLPMFDETKRTVIKTQESLPVDGEDAGNIEAGVGKKKGKKNGGYFRNKKAAVKEFVERDDKGNIKQKPQKPVKKRGVTVWVMILLVVFIVIGLVGGVLYATIGQTPGIDNSENNNTKAPTIIAPIASPTESPTPLPTSPTQAPTIAPTKSPTPSPTRLPTPSPSKSPTKSPTKVPTPSPTKKPSPTQRPTRFPNPSPTQFPSPSPTPSPTKIPTPAPVGGSPPTFSPIVIDLSNTAGIRQAEEVITRTCATIVPTPTITTKVGMCIGDNNHARCNRDGTVFTDTPGPLGFLSGSTIIRNCGATCVCADFALSEDANPCTESGGNTCGLTTTATFPPT